MQEPNNDLRLKVIKKIEQETKLGQSMNNINSVTFEENNFFKSFVTKYQDSSNKELDSKAVHSYQRISDFLNSKQQKNKKSASKLGPIKFKKELQTASNYIGSVQEHALVFFGQNGNNRDKGFAKTNSATSGKYVPFDNSLDSSIMLNQQDKPIKKSGQEKLEIREILSHLETIKKAKNSLNLEPLEIELVFYFSYNNRWEKIRLLVPAQSILGKVSEHFFSLISKKSIKFIDFSIQTAQDQNNFEWRKSTIEIPNDASPEDLEGLIFEEESVSTYDIIDQDWSNL